MAVEFSGPESGVAQTWRGAANEAQATDDDRSRNADEAENAHVDAGPDVEPIDAANALADADSDADATAAYQSRAALPRAADDMLLGALLARLVDHNEAALAELYDATIGRVHGLALRIVRNAETAEEVAEDTFWQVWRQAPRFDPARGSALAWLLTIARSRALDALRRVDRAECVADADDLVAPDSAGVDDPQDLLAATHRGHRLHAALGQLEPLPRQLVALAFFQGLTHEEIARQSCLPLGTVKSQLRRALIALRKTLSTDSPAPAP